MNVRGFAAVWRFHQTWFGGLAKIFQFSVFNSLGRHALLGVFAQIILSLLPLLIQEIKVTHFDAVIGQSYDPARPHGQKGMFSYAAIGPV